jgi:predicted nuclease of predicted toxin-antitoxin system
VRFKLDENLPTGLELAIDFDTVMDEGLAGESDDAVWAAAQAEGRILVTQDLDFSDLRKFAPGSHHGIVLLRLSTPSRRALTERLVELFTSQPTATWGGAFVVVTDTKIRIRRP